MVDWKKKLSSRKFWALVAGVATSVMVLLKVDQDTAVQVTALIGAIGSVVAYMFAEAYVDGKATESEFVLIEEKDEEGAE